MFVYRLQTTDFHEAFFMAILYLLSVILPEMMIWNRLFGDVCPGLWTQVLCLIRQYTAYYTTATSRKLVRLFSGFLARALTDVIYTDFSKDHGILLLKLELIGINSIPDIIFRWLGSYLSLRNQRVLIRNLLSKTVYITSGVPQDSHFESFTVFIVS